MSSLAPPSRYERVSSVSSDLKPRAADDLSLELHQNEEDEDELASLAQQKSSHDPHDTSSASLPTSTSSILFFGLAGLLNNAPYVIMLACAKSISEGGVAAVYIANIIPGLVVKLTAPYWFDHVSYQVRLQAAAVCMAVAFSVTATFTSEQTTSSSSSARSSFWVLAGELSGVALVSLQCGLGEASLLALAGKWDRQRRERDASAHTHHAKGQSLTAFSSGTGLAGPLGYLWKICLTEWLGWSVTFTLFTAALLLSLSYGFVCHKLARDTTDTSTDNDDDYIMNADGDGIFISKSGTDVEDEGQELVPYHHRHQCTNNTARQTERQEEDNTAPENNEITNEASSFVDEIPNDAAAGIPPQRIEDLSFAERFQLIRTMCWPYMVPLFLVYAAEYACQAGAWTAIGFPVTSEAARSAFYEQSNWLYQAGVFLSRSSGTLFTVNMAGLWIMPGLQLLNLILFSTTAATGAASVQGLLYHRSILLVASLYTGLLGGAVYVHGYKRIVADVPAAYTEFCLAATSVAEGLGVLAADIAGLFLQSCLYEKNGLQGALVQCPL